MNMEYKTERLQKEEEILLLGPCPIENKSKFTNILNSLPILAVDGGVKHLNAKDEALSIGDGDSANLAMDISHPTKKDKSDLSLALEFIGKSPKLVHCYGFTGERLDHQLINFGEFFHYSKSTSSKLIIDEKTLIFPSGVNQFTHEGTFSVLSLWENELRLTGECEYQIENPTSMAAFSSRGLSNVAKGLIEINSSYPVAVLLS
jgi:thiamine pyrophosphokinase